MSALELRASLALASIFGLRLFGLFIILPVFALYAEALPGWNLTLVGIALGAYGLTQALLQIPFGWASDRLGRKPVMVFGLLVFATGSVVCAVAEAPWALIAGRTIQGAGAISGVAIAMTADLTRPSQRTKAMAIIGSTIGVVIAASFMVAPALKDAVGVPGIFAATAAMALAAIAVVAWAVPALPAQPAIRERVPFSRVLGDPELLRLYLGIFALHAILMALFLVVPLALVRAGLPVASHSLFYLAVVGAGFVFMLPFVASRRFAAHERAVFLGSVAVMGAGLAVTATGLGSLTVLSTGLVIFFAAFNVLEAKLPALVSKAAPGAARGAAGGVYSSVQFLGIFAGGAAGGATAQHAGPGALLAACFTLTALWFVSAWPMGRMGREGEHEHEDNIGEPREPRAINP
ncbi:MAG: MFS transporter [Betaproteobacteria bacterium]|nr:MFS transporter [Betaproteobacteria bacterium]